MDEKDKDLMGQQAEAAGSESFAAEAALSEEAKRLAPAKKTRRRKRLTGVFTLERVKVGLLAVIAVCLVVLVVQNFFPVRRDVWVDGGYVDADVSGSTVGVDNVVHVWVNGGHKGRGRAHSSFLTLRVAAALAGMARGGLGSACSGTGGYEGRSLPRHGAVSCLRKPGRSVRRDG